MMRPLLITLLLALTPLLASAQGRDRGSFSMLTEPDAAVEGGGKLDLRESRLTTGLPPIIRGGSMVNIGLEWTHYEFETEGTLPADFTTDSIGLPVRWGFGPRNGLAGSLIFSPSLRTDFDGISMDDVGLAGLALGSYPWRTNVTVIFGAVYSRSFGRDRLFPALGATLTPTTNWQVDLVFPRPRVSYQATEKTKVYLGVEPGGDQWNVHQQGVARDLALEEYRAGGGLEYALRGRLSLALQAGQVFARNVKIYDGRDRESKRDLEDTWFARIGLVYK